jgi:ribosomal 50S subunit-associated protein YjgA (DUF615 family)
LRQGEGAPVEAALARLEAQHRRRVEHDKRIAVLRDRLICEVAWDEEALRGIVGTEREQLTTLIDRARQERATGVDRGAARALLRHLRQLLAHPAHP